MISKTIWINYDALCETCRIVDCPVYLEDVMSYDFSMMMDCGGMHPINLGFHANYTYNVSPMFYLSFPGGEGINIIHGLTGEQAIQYLNKAIENMESRPFWFRAMNPVNGWGNYEGAIDILHELKCWCECAPLAIMDIS